MLMTLPTRRDVRMQNLRVRVTGVGASACGETRHGVYK